MDILKIPDLIFLGPPSRETRAGEAILMETRVKLERLNLRAMKNR